jgi:hypothetical protein
MDQLLTRRSLLAAGCALPFVTLAGCAGYGGLSTPEEALRRLLILSTQGAARRLVQDRGFLTDSGYGIPLPPDVAQGRGGGIAERFMQSRLLQGQLHRIMNNAAAEAANRAFPFLLDSVRRMSFTDAVGILRGGSTSATSFMERTVGTALVDAIFPEVGASLRALDYGPTGELAWILTGVNTRGIHQHIAGSAARSIYRAIGEQEAAIRANPHMTRDPLLIAMLGGGR